MAGADAVVEVLGERLEVDVRRVDVCIEVLPGLRADVPGGDGYRLDPAFVAGIGDVDRVLEKDRRVVVGERHAAATQRRGRLREQTRRGGVRKRVDLPGLRDVPVLAEPAGEVAARGAERQHRRARQEVVKWLLLYRIDAKPAGTSIRRQHDPIGGTATHEAQPALPLMQPARPRADVALNAAVVESMPI